MSLKTYFPRARDELLVPIENYINKKYNKLITCHLLAQLAHESDGFHTIEEYASGKAYEGRKDLGNTSPGDGVKYKGRGYIQITGKHNYSLCGKALTMDLVNYPELLLDPQNAMLASRWFWNSHNLDALALQDNIMAITKVINGSYNGITNRQYYLTLFKGIIK